MNKPNLHYPSVLETIHFCTGIPTATLREMVPPRSRSIKRWRVRVRNQTKQAIIGLKATKKLVRNNMKGFVQQKPEKYAVSFGK